MEEKTLTVRIDGLENHTWQGVLRADGEAYPFRSALELMMAIDGLLLGKPAAETAHNGKRRINYAAK